MKLNFVLRQIKCNECFSFSSWGIRVENKVFCDVCGSDYTGINHSTLTKMKEQKENAAHHRQQHKPSRRYF